DLFLILWTPTGNSTKDPYAVPLVSAFFLLVLFLAVWAQIDRRLGGIIRSAPGPASLRAREEDAVQPSEPPASPPPLVQPAPRLSIQVRGVEGRPRLSADAAARVQQGRELYTLGVGLVRWTAWRLAFASLWVVLLGGVVERPYPAPGALLFWA